MLAKAKAAAAAEASSSSDAPLAPLAVIAASLKDDPLLAGTSAATAANGANAVGPLQWDRSTLGANIVLKDDGYTAVHATSQWNAVCGTRWIGEGVHEIEIATECVDNASLFLGVVERSYVSEAAAAIAAGEQYLPRDSKHAICMHGDGRVFIRGVEKEWGMMRVSTGDPVLLTLDWDRGLVVFKLTRTVRGRERETIAEIPGLRGEVTLVVCFGGRDQELRIARHDKLSQPRAAGVKKVRDNFADALGSERVAPIAFSAPAKVASYEEQIRDVAATMESSM